MATKPLPPNMPQDQICERALDLITAIVPENMTHEQSATFFAAMAITAIETLKKHTGVNYTAVFLEDCLQELTTEPTH